jgi:hypothetical protein
MSEKKQFNVRLETKVLKAIEKWAEDEFRSTNAQIEFILVQALNDSGRLKTKTEAPK